MPVHNVYPAGGVHPTSGQVIHPADLLAALGLVLSVEIKVPPALAAALTSQGQPIPSPVSGYALVDTGATGCCVEESLVQGLGLQVIRQANVCGTSGVRLQKLIGICFLTLRGSVPRPVTLLKVTATPP